MVDVPVALANLLRVHARFCRSNGSPFYADLMEHMADDAEAGGPVTTLAAPDVGAPEGGYRLRILGGVHRLVLEGAVPELARHYPSTGGDGDAATAWPVIRALLDDRHPVVLDALMRPPQTNEVGRSASLVGGFLVVAAETRLPLRLLELGSSAGLNLRVARYRYEQDGSGFGDPTSPVRFASLWQGGRPPFEARCRIAERRGCDRDPIDATTENGRLKLLSYVWPGQTDRFTMLAAALEIARDDPVAIDAALIPAWLETHLAEPAPGRATVVFHSIVWSYLTDAERVAATETLRAAGGRARPDAPLAWLRLESVPDLSSSTLTLTTWPGGDERLLARAGFHVGPIDWLA
jgi:hypothetical protein